MLIRSGCDDDVIEIDDALVEMQIIHTWPDRLLEGGRAGGQTKWHEMALDFKTLEVQQRMQSAVYPSHLPPPTSIQT